LTCFPNFGLIIAGKFQFNGMCDSGRWTREDHEEIEVYGGAANAIGDVATASARGRERQIEEDRG
jgi:hypothetical protein